MLASLALGANKIFSLFTLITLFTIFTMFTLFALCGKHGICQMFPEIPEIQFQ